MFYHRDWCGIWTHVKIRYFSCEDIDDFSDINFVSLIVLKFVGVSSKHLRIFLESLRESSEIFGNFRKFTENVRERSSGLGNNFGKSSEIFGKWSEIFGKSSKTPSSVSLYNKQNNRRLLDSSYLKIWKSWNLIKQIYIFLSRDGIMHCLVIRYRSTAKLV